MRYGHGRGRGAGSEEQVRVRFPREGEVLGVVEQLLGYAKMRVKCADGKTRICRVPGRMMRVLWVRERDVIIVKPWEISSETKGDVIYKYKKTQINILKQKGLLENLESEL